MRIEETVEGFTLITELVTAKEMYLYDCATHQHSEYSTDFSEFREDNDIQCGIRSYDFIGNTVIATILFWNVKNFKEEHVVKIQKYIEKKMRE